MTDATLVTAGLSSAATYPYKIFVGSTPSTSADDLLVGTGALAWSGSAAIPPSSNVTHWKSDGVPTSDSAGHPKVTIKDGTGPGEIDTDSGLVMANVTQIGAAQGGSSNSIELAASASSIDGTYRGQLIYLDSGTGAGQCRLITVYNGADKIANVAPNWNTTPVAGTTYRILPHGRINGVEGTVTGSVGSIASGGITSGSFTAGAIDAAAMNVTGSEFTAIPWNAVWDAEAQSEANDALVANFLDQLFAAAYNPASEPGNAAALLNILMENDGGVPRFTANALEQAP